MLFSQKIANFFSIPWAHVDRFYTFAWDGISMDSTRTGGSSEEIDNVNVNVSNIWRRILKYHLQF
jgi:hypothetical protein